jgi:hypothetical protein
MGTSVSEVTTSETVTAAASFTKWMVGEGPVMAGIAGGVVGEGTFAGRVLEMQVGPTTTVEAIYGFEGSEGALKALVHVEQTGLEAVISGVVIEGASKGSPVRGAYSEIQCEHDGVTTDCWRGRLEILGG